jgi:2-polyprenyl-3-methyl-5-hydroxy-6-metoxy-1,4-benzoquinol methylase
MEPNLDEALDRLKTRRFDCIILNEVLEHFPKPQYLLVRLAQLLDKKGQMLICIRNHRNLRYWKKRWLNDSVIIKIDKISDFSQYQYRIPRNSEICAWLQAANLYLKRKRYLVPATVKFKALRTFSLAHRWFANKFVITAARLCGLVLGITLCENYLNG